MQDHQIEKCCVGISGGFRQVLGMVACIASRECPIILMGESGTGKELIAQQIHLNSKRHTAPFVPVDCTNLSSELFASQLFGHVKGAFTGADRDTVGFFRAADGGTIFLDEIGELPLPVQAKLLRVLQEYRITPIGSTQSFPVDVRVVCATNRNLEEMVQKGSFRNDLYYRLNVMNVRIPPLRERTEDILDLAEHFLKQQALLYNESIKRLSPETQSLLLHYPWPGNIRELANAMEHAHILTSQQLIMPSALPKEIAVDAIQDKTTKSFPTVDQCDRNIILSALKQTGGRKLKAARLLGLERRRLNRMIERLNITLPTKSDRQLIYHFFNPSFRFGKKFNHSAYIFRGHFFETGGHNGRPRYHYGRFLPNVFNLLILEANYVCSQRPFWSLVHFGN